MIRAITLPNGRTVSLPTYCRAWRELKRLPGDADISGFNWYAVPAAAVLREIRAGMHERINWRAPHYGKGRKWSDQWQRDASHTARRVNTPRLIVREPEVHPVELRARLAHRITTE